MGSRVLNSVRDNRLAAGLTQEELGRAVGVSRQTIISIEGGRYVPSLPLAIKLARYFGRTTDEIFNLEQGS